jgi:hypothetical protein
MNKNMKYEKVKNLKTSEFKRVVGVKKETFEIMCEEYKKHEKKRKKGIGGRKAILLPKDKVFFMLEYYREYRTLLHISVDYGISEATASRVVRDVEKALIKSKKFSLPSKRELIKKDIKLETITIDATEIEIQRPKKNKKNTIQEKRKNIQ